MKQSTGFPQRVGRF